MKTPILGIISAIQSGIPAIKEIVGLFKKNKPITDEPTLAGMSQPSLIEHIKKLESGNQQSISIRLTHLAITLATIYGVVWAAKQLGVTYQDIINLWGLIG